MRVWLDCQTDRQEWDIKESKKVEHTDERECDQTVKWERSDKQEREISDRHTTERKRDQNYRQEREREMGQTDSQVRDIRLTDIQEREIKQIDRQTRKSDQTDIQKKVSFYNGK